MSEVILPAEEGKTTIALGIEYDGSRYYGWQRQSEVASVQGCLEKALSKVAAEPVSVFCAGLNRCRGACHRPGGAFSYGSCP